MSRIIKRYENRKLYDTENCKYVSLEEIAALVRRGVDVKVVDQKKGADLTAQTLTQILFEEGKRGRNPFSAEMLHDIIRWGSTMVDGGIQQVRQKLDHLVPKPFHEILGLTPGDDLQKLIAKVNALEEAISKLVEQKSLGSADNDNTSRSATKKQI